MKRLIICLLLLGILGCGATADKAVTEFNKGVEFADREDWGNAIASYSEAIRINPDYADAYYNRGCVYDELGQCKKAISDYCEVMRINLRTGESD